MILATMAATMMMMERIREATKHNNEVVQNDHNKLNRGHRTQDQEQRTGSSTLPLTSPRASLLLCTSQGPDAPIYLPLYLPVCLSVCLSSNYLCLRDLIHIASAHKFAETTPTFMHE